MLEGTRRIVRSELIPRLSRTILHFSFSSGYLFGVYVISIGHSFRLMQNSNTTLIIHTFFQTFARHRIIPMLLFSFCVTVTAAGSRKEEQQLVAGTPDGMQTILNFKFVHLFLTLRTKLLKEIDVFVRTIGS